MEKKRWFRRGILFLCVFLCAFVLIQAGNGEVKAETVYPRRVVEIRPGVVVVPGITIVPEIVPLTAADTEMILAAGVVDSETEETSQDIEDELTPGAGVVGSETEEDLQDVEDELTPGAGVVGSEIEEEPTENEGEPPSLESDDGNDDLEEPIPEENSEEDSEKESEENSEKDEEKEREENSEEDKEDAEKDNEKNNEDEEEISEETEETEEAEEPEELEEAEESEEPEEPICDLAVALKADQEEVKAGGEILYECIIKNTGEQDLHDLKMNLMFSKETVPPQWQKMDGLKVSQNGNQAVLQTLKAGMEQHIHYAVLVSEEQTDPLECILHVNVEEKESRLIREAQCCTVVIPLKIDFSVEKIADRKETHPGEEVYYTIRLYNTGERTLHSIITTERFQQEGITALFLPQEGVALNDTRTKAYIAKMESGEEVLLKAKVLLPENLKPRDLLNQVIVTTSETGEQNYHSEAVVQVIESQITPIQITPTPIQERPVQEQLKTEAEEQIYQAQAVKTGDESKGELWRKLAGASFLLIFLLLVVKRRKDQNAR